MEKRFYKLPLRIGKEIETLYLEVDKKGIDVYKEVNKKDKIVLVKIPCELSKKEYANIRKNMTNVIGSSSISLEKKVYFEKEAKRIEKLKKTNERLPALS